MWRDVARYGEMLRNTAVGPRGPHVVCVCGGSGGRRGCVAARLEHLHERGGLLRGARVLLPLLAQEGDLLLVRVRLG